MNKQQIKKKNLINFDKQLESNIKMQSIRKITIKTHLSNIILICT